MSSNVHRFQYFCSHGPVPTVTVAEASGLALIGILPSLARGEGWGSMFCTDGSLNGLAMPTFCMAVLLCNCIVNGFEVLRHPLPYCTCAAKAFYYCPSMNSHRPRSQNISKERALNPEKDSSIKRPRSHISSEKSSQNYQPLEN